VYPEKAMTVMRNIIQKYRKPITSTLGSVNEKPSSLFLVK
jgi:hypothetical protein